MSWSTLDGAATRAPRSSGCSRTGKIDGTIQRSCADALAFGCMIASISTAMPRGRAIMPTAERAGRPAYSPNTSTTNRSVTADHFRLLAEIRRTANHAENLHHLMRHCREQAELRACAQAAYETANARGVVALFHRKIEPTQSVV